MNIRDFDDNLKEELLGFIRNKTLVPIIGSGFTVQCKSRNGIVPSGSKMKNYMFGELKRELGEEVLGNFSKVASAYDRHIKIDTRHKYLKDNFTYVQLEDEKLDFLNIDWPYMYTLNIDDAIEYNNTNYKIILPNKEINKNFILENKCLFKLHGDVNDVLKYRNSDEKIFTRKEYLRSLQNNIALLDLLKNDYESNNIIFIGCSLEDEIDILSTIISVNNKKTYRNKVYYLTHEDLGEVKKGELEDFGITDIIKINDSSEYKEVYIKFKQIYNESNKVKKDELSRFKDLKIEKSNSNKRSDNIPYLFESNKIMNKLDIGKISVPSYFIERDVTTKLVDNIDKSTIHIIEGNRVSGKTYCLIDILSRINDRAKYYIPSDITLNDVALSNLINGKNLVLIFDSNSVTNDQFKYIVENHDKIEKNKTVIIFAINTSDREIIADIKSNEDIINRVPLESNFSDTEMKYINKKLSLTDMDIFDSKLSLLDNIIRLDKIVRERREKVEGYNVPKLSKIAKEDLIIMILLATKEKISSYDITIFNLIENIAAFENITKPATQFSYTSLYEENNHSGYKVIANAKYWVLNTLGEYSIIHKNEIAEAYKAISDSLKVRHNQENKFFKEMAKYINFDILNSIFPKNIKKGSAGLIGRIYEKLHDDLCNDPQYFHQRAKSIYWLKRNDSIQLEEALKLVDKSINDIEVSRDVNNDNIKNSISHIEYTKALIVGRICNLTQYRDIELTKSAIECYYRAFTNPRNSAYTSDLKKRNGDHKVMDLKDLLDKSRQDEQIKKEFKFEITKLYEVLIG